MTRLLRPLAAGLALLLASCGLPAAPNTPQSATEARSAEPTAPPASPVAGPTTAAVASGQSRPPEPASGWPRTVQTPRGTVTIPHKPQRIHTLSVGFDEITFALVDPSRVVAVGTATTNPDYSNVADLAAQVPRQVGRDAEAVIAANPDLVVASPFAKEDLVRALENAGITVVVADLVSSVEAHERNIRLLAYLYGEEEKGERLIHELRDRLAKVDAVVGQKAPGERPRALMLIGNLYTPGAGSNEDGIIRRAGGINVAAEAGISGNKQVSLEAIPAMQPDLFLLVEQEPAKATLQQTVLTHPALQELPAIKEGRSFPVTHRFVTTLSHWNVNGVEELARIFYPNDFR